jgi:hypothetical protein
MTNTFLLQNVKKNADKAMLQFNQTMKKYEISSTFSDKLMHDSRKKIIVIDNSGSMLTKTQLNDGKSVTRYEELYDQVAQFIDINGAIDSSGLNVYFLNPINGHYCVKNVTSKEQLGEFFGVLPEGFTPITKVCEQILRDEHKNIIERGLSITLFTDGAPTDDYGNCDVGGFYNFLTKTRKLFEKVLSNATNQLYFCKGKVYITIVICTDQDDDVEYLKDWDNKNIPNFDVVDDYKTVLNEVQSLQGSQFKYTYGNHLVKITLGNMDRWFNKLNEFKVSKEWSFMKEPSKSSNQSVWVKGLFLFCIIYFVSIFVFLSVNERKQLFLQFNTAFNNIIDKSVNYLSRSTDLSNLFADVDLDNTYIFDE